MKDLGQMGESTFRLWCADAGLIANPSVIDKTGWDFLVEFPFTSKMSSTDIHKSAHECKVQVKATNKRNRKISITLSNLRRLITAQMPAFLFFIEFDEQPSAQSAFVVHIDNSIISNVLRRMRQIEQSGKDNNFNKRTMTISYDDSHRLMQLNGASLRQCFLNYIGDDFAEYVAKKKIHLESTGFEKGYAEMTFSIEDEDEEKKLINVSLGIDEVVSISDVKCFASRFGIKSNTPLFHYNGGELEMPNVKPYEVGRVRFKEDDLDTGMTFDAKIYISPFNAFLSDDLKKFRVAGEFFEMSFNPYSGTATCSFLFDENMRLEVKKFREAIKLINALALSGKKILVDMIFNGLPELRCKIYSNKKDLDYAEDLKILDCINSIILQFDFSDYIDISYYEILAHKERIISMCKFFNSSPALFKAEFSVDFDACDFKSDVACISIVGAPIGEYAFYVLFVMKGTVKKIGIERFMLIPCEVVVEKKFVSKKGDDIFNEKFDSIIDGIENNYSDRYTVISIINSLK